MLVYMRPPRRTEEIEFLQEILNGRFPKLSGLLCVVDNGNFRYSFEFLSVSQFSIWVLVEFGSNA